MSSEKEKNEESTLALIKRVDQILDEIEKKHGKPNLTKEEWEKIEDLTGAQMRYMRYQRQSNSNEYSDKISKQQPKLDARPFYKNFFLIFLLIIILIFVFLKKVGTEYKIRREALLTIEMEKIAAEKKAISQMLDDYNKKYTDAQLAAERDPYIQNQRLNEEIKNKIEALSGGKEIKESENKKPKN